MPLNDVTLLIKTFERPYCLQTLLGSYRRLYQTMGWVCPILIADDSQAPYKTRIEAEFGDLVTDYICLPFNVGLSAGRNTLLDRVETPYFLLCDDDFIFDKRANLAFMRRILATTDVELLGGLFLNRTIRIHDEPAWRFFGRFLRRRNFAAFWSALMKRDTIARFQGNYEVTNQTLSTKPIQYSPPFTRCDYVNNFFMAETVALRRRGVRWNDALKINEHEAFFFEAKQKELHVATTEEVGIVHQPILSENYNKYRYKYLEHGDQYRQLFLQQQGLTHFVDEMFGIEVSL